MNMTLTRLLVLLFGLQFSLPLSAHCDEPDFKLNQIKSIAVTASLIAYPELELSTEALQAPFEKLIRNRGISLEKSINDNSVTFTATINRVLVNNERLYIVNVSAQYDERCNTVRTKQEVRCTLWQFYQPIATFTSPAAARQHVLQAVDTAAKEFQAVVDHKGK